MKLPRVHSVTECDIDYFCVMYPDMTRDEVEDILDALALDDLYSNHDEAS